MEKFSYFDVIAHIVPGSLLLGALALLVKSKAFILITGNDAIDTILFTIISFVIGAFLHQLGNQLIERLVKRSFWHGKMYSELYLVKKYNLCREPLRSQVLNIAKTLLKFDRTSLSCLDSSSTLKGKPDPHVVSHQVFRRFDYYTSDKGLAQKGHLANTLYSLYRTLTLTMLILGILFAISYNWSGSAIGVTPKIILASSCFLAAVIFLIRTRKEGERYIQGVLSAVTKSSSQ